MTKFIWTKRDAGFRCIIEGSDVTLYVEPASYARGITPKAARGTKWRAGATVWCEATKTGSRFGRDVYADQRDTAKEAMRLAEAVYTEATNP